jgi:DNA-binding HxlR family transcriptional regulator
MSGSYNYEKHIVNNGGRFRAISGARYDAQCGRYAWTCSVAKRVTMNFVVTLGKNMKRRANLSATVCPVARSLDVVGDRWSVLILRELFMGASRFEEILIQTEATPQMLATRLKALEADGMVERHPYQHKPLRHEYRLTEKATAFYPVVYALRAWGETWCKDGSEGVAVRFTHRACGHDVGLADVCPVCGTPVERSELDAQVSEGFEKERADRRAAFKASRDPEGRPQ